MLLVRDPITAAIKLTSNKEMGGATSLVCQSGTRSVSNQQAVDTIDWTVRCDWLQVASFCIILYTQNIMLNWTESLAALLARFIVDVIGFNRLFL